MEIGNIVSTAFMAIVVFYSVILAVKTYQLKDRVEALEHLITKLIDDSNDRKTL